MKKFLTLLLAAGMVVSAASGASAVEMKVSGSWLTSFTFADNLFGKNALTKDADEGTFNAAHRVRVNFDMVASESLSGRVQLEVANLSKTEHSDGQYYTWGYKGHGRQRQYSDSSPGLLGLGAPHHRCTGAHGPSVFHRAVLYLRFSGV